MPGRGVEIEAVGHPPRRLAGGRGQGGQELQLRRGGFRPQAQVGGGGRQAGEDQGLGLVGGHAGQAGAVAFQQLEAAAGSPVGVDRHPRRAELVGVPVDGPHRDLELRRQRLGGHPAAQLQQHQDGEESAGAHFFSLAENT